MERAKLYHYVTQESAHNTVLVPLRPSWLSATSLAKKTIFPLPTYPRTKFLPGADGAEESSLLMFLNDIKVRYRWETFLSSLAHFSLMSHP